MTPEVLRRQVDAALVEVVPYETDLRFAQSVAQFCESRGAARHRLGRLDRIWGLMRIVDVPVDQTPALAARAAIEADPERAGGPAMVHEAC